MKPIMHQARTESTTDHPPLGRRIRYAARYVRYCELPPKPHEEAWVIYWLTLGRTGDFTAAAAARDTMMGHTAADQQETQEEQQSEPAT